VRQPQQLEAPGEAFGEAALDEKRRRAEHHHPERALRTRILVTEALDGFRPRLIVLSNFTQDVE
jgi:hypothetical protein